MPVTNELIRLYTGTDWRLLAESTLIDGVGTFSKRWDQYIEGVYDTHCISQQGHTLLLASGQEVIDWVGALGANFAGTNVSHSLPTIWEVILADKLQQRLGRQYRFKFLREGSSACNAAIRYARAYTNRKMTFGHGYHGYGETFISAEAPGLGCLYQHYHKFEDLGALIRALEAVQNGVDRPAAVIVEPVVLDMGVESQLKRIRDLCRQLDSPLIVDEIVSGGRVPQFTINNLYSLDADIICLGKALGMGHPLGIVGVRDSMLIPGVFVSTTFAGSLPSIMGAIDYLEITDTALLKLWQQGSEFMTKFNNLSKRIQLIGYPTRMTWRAEDLDLAIFWQEMYKRGHLLGKAFFLTFANRSRINELLSDAEEVLKKMESETITLNGLLPRPVFRRF